MIRLRVVRNAVLVVLLLLCLSGCNTISLRDNLSQEQANQIVVVLQAQGISAQVSRESGARGRYKVEVKQTFYSQANAILFEHFEGGTPPELGPSFAELIAQQGLLPNSRELEALRVERARAAEIEEMVRAHPAVATARVKLSQSTVDKDGKEQGPSMGVLLVMRQGVQASEAMFRDLLTKAAPDIPADRISLALTTENDINRPMQVEGVSNEGIGTPIRIPLTGFLWKWRIPEDDYNGLAVVLILGIVCVFGLGTIIGCWYAFYHIGVAQAKAERSRNALGGVDSERSALGRGTKPKPELLGD